MALNDPKANLGVALAAILLCLGLLAFGRGSPQSTGDDLIIEVTIVPSDANDLDCNGTASFGGLRCAFAGNQRVTSNDSALRPFVSTHGELLLLANVFASPSVAKWLAGARANERVVLSCQARSLGTVPEVGVRFRSDAAFDTRPQVAAAQALDCKVRSDAERRRH